MPHPQLDRKLIKMLPLAERRNKKFIERDHVPLGFRPVGLSAEAEKVIDSTAERILSARASGAPVMLAFGAHAIKNGLAPVLIELISRGWVTHLATNGAGVIHDWEFAWQGASSEEVRGGIERGEFGHWRETGYFINLAINIGAWRGLGYGEAVGAMIESEELEIPAKEQLEGEATRMLSEDPEQAGAAAELLGIVQKSALPAGKMTVPHPFKIWSVQAAAWRLGVPFTAHPMIGHDIIYNHPLNHGALLGRAALRDYLTFAGSVSRLSGGVYLSLGSAVMSPMVFEKSMAMAQNLALQEGRRIENHTIVVVDLAASQWDWTKGEPPEENPDYYLRYNKSFARMGGTLHYLTADNRDFLMGLFHCLMSRQGIS